MRIKMRLISAALASVLLFSAVPANAAESGAVSVTYSAAAGGKLAAPEDLYAKKVTYSSVTLKWDKVKGADAYIVYRYNSSTKKYKKLKTVTKTQYKVTKLSEQTEYIFCVAAAVKDESGKYKAQKKSDKLTVETESNPALEAAAPENYRVTEKSSDYVIVAWDAADGADAYKVELYSKSSGKYEKVKSTKRCKCKITGLEAGTEYKIRVTSLVKIDGKYKAAESETLRISTESNAADIPDGELVEPGVWESPELGVDISSALSTTHVGSYNVEQEEGGITQLVGSVYISNDDVYDIAGMWFNSLGQLYEYALLFSCENSVCTSISAYLLSESESHYSSDGYEIYIFPDDLVTMAYSSGIAYLNVHSKVYSPMST